MAGMWITVIKTFKCSKINKKRLKINKKEQQLNFFCTAFLSFPLVCKDVRWVWISSGEGGIWPHCESWNISSNTFGVDGVPRSLGFCQGHPCFPSSLLCPRLQPPLKQTQKIYGMCFLAFLGHRILCSLEPMSVSATWWQWWIQTRLRRYKSLSWFTFCSSGLCDCKYNLCNILYSFL